MKRALLVLLLAGCERDGVRFHLPSQSVGSRSTYHMRIDGSFKTPDGVDHGMHHELSLIMVVEALGSNARADQIRVTVDRDDSVLDGHPQPTLSGTYEVHADGTASRADGKPLAPHELEFFKQWRDPGSDPEGMSHVFHAGETFRPTAREVDAFELPHSKTPVAYTVRRATDAEIVLAGDYVPDDAGSDIEAHGSVVVTLTPHSHTRVGDVTLRRGSNDVGAMHATSELRRLPQR